MTLAIADAVSQQQEATQEIAGNVTLAAERSEAAAGNVRAVTEVAVKTDTEAADVAENRKNWRKTPRGSPRRWRGSSTP